MKDVGSTIDNARDATMHAATGAIGGLFHTVKSVVEVAVLLRSLGAGKALGNVSLMRPRARGAGLGIFAAGLVVGAGLGMLLAPKSGRQTRSYMRQQLGKIGGEVKTQALAAAEQAEAKLEEVFESAEEAVEEGLDSRAPKGKKARRSASSA